MDRFDRLMIAAFANLAAAFANIIIFAIAVNPINLMMVPISLGMSAICFTVAQYVKD